MARDVAKFPGPFIAAVRTPRIIGPVRNLELAANTFRQLAGSAHDRLDREAVQQAEIDARKQVAETGKPVTSPHGGLYGQAFDRAMQEAYGNVVELRLREKVEEVSRTHPNDPHGAQAAVDTWAKGFRTEMPPGMRPEFDLRAQILTGPLISRARTNAFNLAKDGAQANAIALRSSIYRNLDNVAPGIFSGDPQQVQQSFDTISLEWGQLSKQYGQLSADGQPLFSKKEVAEKQIEFFDRVYTSGLRGWVDASPDKIKAYQELIRGDVSFEIDQMSEDGKTVKGKKIKVNPMEQTTREQRDKILGYAQSQMNAYISALNRVESKAEKELATQHDLFSSQAMRRMIDNDPERPFDRVWLDTNEHNFDPNDYRAFLKAVEEGPETDDTDTVLQIEDMIEGGQDAWPTIREKFSGGDLTKKTFFSLRSRNKSLFSDRSPSNSYRRITDYLDTAFGQRTQFDKYEPIIALGAQARIEFDSWWDEQSTDGVAPTFEEGYEHAQALLFNRLPPAKLKMFLNTVIPRPDRRYTVANDADPTVINAKETAKKLFSTFKIDPRSDNATWPPELVRQIRLLDEYQNGYDRYLEIRDSYNASETTPAR